MNQSAATVEFKANRNVSASTSVDPEEVARFERLASAWWDPQGVFWPLHGLNRFRSSYLLDVLTDAKVPGSLVGRTVLDIGCGGGLLSEEMARAGAQVTGIDVVGRNVEIARRHANESGLCIDYLNSTAEQLAASGQRFDIVLNMEVVEHVSDLGGFLEACAELVRPGGQMVVSTINRTALAWLFAIFGAEYVLRWLPRGTHQWPRFVKPDELKDWLEDSGLHLKRQVGVRVNPFNRSFHLSRNLQVNYMALYERSPGLQPD
jgi:2-polyprenyl-6-hydroxyphenyl methylase/3-demethylubiquinone-9 3-methyltransferase